MRHIILCGTRKAGQHYAKLMGFKLMDHCVVSCCDPDPGRQLRGLATPTAQYVIHRTQSWYRASWSNAKMKIRDLVQTQLFGRCQLTIVNEVDVVNTTFMS